MVEPGEYLVDRKDVEELIRNLGGEDAKGSLDLPDKDGVLKPVIPREGTRLALLASSDLIEIVDLEDGLVRWRCGHQYPARYGVLAYGRTFGMSEEFYAERPWCGPCNVSVLKTISIRCGRCGHIITIGDPSTLYPASAEFMAHPNWVTMYEGKVICCMRDRCMTTSGFYAGEWMLGGFTPRFGGRTMAEESLRIGQPIGLNLRVRE